MELTNKRFYLVTLFVPQACPVEDKPHPVIASLVEAAKKYRFEL